MGLAQSILYSSPPPRSLAPVLDWLLIPGGKDILDFEEAGIALAVARLVLLSALCVCVAGDRE